jgi:hypothetical protein
MGFQKRKDYRLACNRKKRRFIDENPNYVLKQEKLLEVNNITTNKQSGGLPTLPPKQTKLIQLFKAQPKLEIPSEIANNTLEDESKPNSIRLSEVQHHTAITYIFNIILKQPN